LTQRLGKRIVHPTLPRYGTELIDTATRDALAAFTHGQLV
jgi:hypothetical protein